MDFLSGATLNKACAKAVRSCDVTFPRVLIKYSNRNISQRSSKSGAILHTLVPREPIPGGIGLPCSSSRIPACSIISKLASLAAYQYSKDTPSDFACPSAEEHTCRTSCAADRGM